LIEREAQANRDRVHITLSWRELFIDQKNSLAWRYNKRGARSIVAAGESALAILCRSSRP